MYFMEVSPLSCNNITKFNCADWENGFGLYGLKSSMLWWEREVVGEMGKPTSSLAP